jgi:capsular polysaccharide export protein
MTAPPQDTAAGPYKTRRLFVYNGGFLTQPRVRRILTLAGYSLRLGLPGQEADDMVGVWGTRSTAKRGEAVGKRRDTPVLRVEDAWLRGLHPGPGTPPLGLTLDTRGLHYDPSAPSDLEVLLASHPLDDTALLDRARGAIEAMKEAHLTKYAAVDPGLDLPPPGYVLVLDQTQGDASVTASGADRNRFLEMLFMAQEEHPGASVLIKTHPAVARGEKAGYFREDDLAPHIRRTTAPHSPWALFEGAVGVYTVSSQLGFEAIFAGHRPRIFGQPFYAGWGLTEDAFPVQRRQRRLTRAQLFAGAMLLYPTWYDPYFDRLCEFEDTARALAAMARAWRADREGWVASGMRLWKRAHVQKFFGAEKPVIFKDEPAAARATGRPWMVWASTARESHADACRVEDGFLRSRGLGADLVPPLSLVTDDLGIYYDATRPSRLEALIACRASLRPDQAARARALIASLRASGVTKYNLSGEASATLPAGAVLVVGQVEDDASIRFGADEVRTNRALIERVRAARPDAALIYKPHPDVSAGLRDGGSGAEDFADIVLDKDPADKVLVAVSEVWTITSLLGFEALLRGVPVVTLGVPFYAGWGLTEDLGAVPPRRRARPGLEGLVHAALIDYPRYLDPKTGLPCPVEVIVARLAQKTGHPRRLGNRLLSKLQGIFAGQAALWRRGG